MLVVNTRHQLPQIGIRQQWSRVDEATTNPARIRTNDRQGKSNQGATQPTTQISSYQSRTAYGLLNMTDYTRRLGQRGFSDAQAATSRKTQQAWANTENSAKRGNDIPQRARSEMFAKYSADTVFQIGWASDPVTTSTPSRVVGTPDVGDVTAEIDAPYRANVSCTPGGAETYIQNEGFIRQWVSDGYDIYA